MAHSYRSRLARVVAWALPLADDRAAAKTGSWCPYALAFVWLFQVLSRGATLDERFNDARDWWTRWRGRRGVAATYQGFVKALRRVVGGWETTFVEAFQHRLRDRVGDRDLVAGWRPRAVDGTRFDCPRSRDCQRTHGRAAREKSAPQLALVTLWHLTLGCWWDGRVASARVGERTLLRRMLDALPPRALLIGDAGFAGFDLCLEIR